VANSRRNVLVGIWLVIAAIAAFVLSRVIGTIIIAVAVSYALVPLHRWFMGHGVPSYWSAILTTLLGVVVSLVLLLPFGFVLYVRRRALLGAIDALDTSIPITLGDQTYMVTLAPIQEVLTPNVSRLAVVIGQQISVLSAKFIVYGFVVFALLYYHAKLRSLVFGPVPATYHYLVDEIHSRIREVIFGHYVLVLVGGVVTYVTGLGVFLLLGYQLPFVLALAGAVLWVLPFISAAPLVVALSLFHLVNGQFVMLLGIASLGTIFIVALPNLAVDAVRFHFGDPERLSQTLYFVGFVGGGLTLGLVGFVAGPLILTILVTLLGLLVQASGPSTIEQQPN